jgi:hypothetical protein
MSGRGTQITGQSIGTPIGRPVRVRRPGVE